MITFMKNTSKKISCLVCCLFLFLVMATGQEREIHYYLLTYKENPSRHIFIARKYVNQRDGRTKVEEFKYSERADSISSVKTYFFQVKDQALIRYLGQEDMIGQVYLKVQQDTSFVFKYEDPSVDDFLGTTYCCLGKDSILKNDNWMTLYKFRGNWYGVVAYAYLDDNFLLERMEWTIEKYFQHFLEHVDSIQVPESFREQVRNYKSELDLEEQANEVVESQDNAPDRCFQAGWLLLGILLLCTCVIYMMRNKQKRS